MVQAKQNDAVNRKINDKSSVGANALAEDLLHCGGEVMHILEELYVGSIRPGERTFKQNSQYGRVIKALNEREEKLDAALSKEQKSLLDEYRNAQQDLMVITDCETFIRGLQIGAKIMLDVLTEGEVKEL